MTLWARKVKDKLELFTSQTDAKKNDYELWRAPGMRWEIQGLDEPLKKGEIRKVSNIITLHLAD